MAHWPPAQLGALKNIQPVESRLFGRTGMRVGVLGFGGAEIGFENTPQSTIEILLDIAADAGMNVVDTAAMYADSEEKLGAALKGARNRFLLFTKCGRSLPALNSIAGIRARGQRILCRERHKDAAVASHLWTRSALTHNVEQSLKRLKTDHIDLIQLHSCSEQLLRKGEVIDTLKRMRDAGKVAHIGFSGEGPAAAYALRCGEFESLQISVNVADQQSLQTLIPDIVKSGIGLIAKRPIANGLWEPSAKADAPHLKTYRARFRDLQFDLATRPYDKALRFTLSVPGVSTAIVGTTNPTHLLQNIQSAGAGDLSREDMEMFRRRWDEIAPPTWVGQS